MSSQSSAILEQEVVSAVNGLFRRSCKNKITQSDSTSIQSETLGWVSGSTKCPGASSVDGLRYFTSAPKKEGEHGGATYQYFASGKLAMYG